MKYYRYPLLALFFFLLLAGLPGLLMAQDKVVELESIPGREDIPENCSTWHELYPNYCTSLHQDGFEDNGDGVLSPCDYIILDGERRHIDWVGPTYWTDCDLILEPIEFIPGDPTGQEWLEIWPNFGVPHIIEGWDGCWCGCERRR